MTLCGVLHVHSSYSYDGRHSVAEIAAMARSRGYAFVCMSDHSDTLSDERMAALVDACRVESTPDCLIVPGVEFTCEGNLHLLGFGVRRLCTEREPVRVARYVRADGGVAVVAHPVRYAYRLPDGLAAALDGVEVWNSGYDGRFVPNTTSIDLLDRLRRENPRLQAFGGQDLHVIKDQCHVRVELECDEPRETEILAALHRGAFRVRNPYFGMASGQPLSWPAECLLRAARAAYVAARAYRNGQPQGRP